MEPEIKNKNVMLVVDDEPGFRDMMQWYFDGQGFTVDVAKDGMEAVKLFESCFYPVIITDLTMPRMNGMQLLEEIQRRAPQIVVIILTGFGTVDTAVYAMKKGASDFILKPFDLEKLKERVRQAVLKKPNKTTFEIWTK